MLASHLVRTDRHLLPHVWAGGLSTPAFDVFDVSDVIDASTWYPTPLRGVPSFAPRTTVLQALARVAFVVPVLAPFLRGARRRTAAGPAPRASLPAA
ncbi:hypothetical protein [Janibacter terrae]|uniref:hypothetical protein n=1 Tax=Janibacter terrae TaxID=103817 RepID=UPI0031F82634